MLEPWAEFIKDTISVIASISSCGAFNAAQYLKYEESKVNEPVIRVSTVTEEKKVKKKKKPNFKKILKYSLAPILITLGGISLISILYIFGSTPSTAHTVSEPMATPPVILTVPLENSMNDAWLDELDPIEPRERAFVWHIWNSFDPVQVKKATFQHSIGVCIPEKDMKAYNTSPQKERKHEEYIEYQLSYNYDTFQFDYGIDDLSFPSGIETACRCEYKIVVQSCNAQDYLGEDDNILFDSDWLNYRSILYRSPLLDVSACESMRITVYWKFNIRQNGPSAFNIAIMNPILRVEKADTMASHPPTEYTKPDSNH